MEKIVLEKLAAVSLFACFLLLFAFALLSPNIASAAAEPFSSTWLTNQIKTVPAEKKTKYAVYVQALGDNSKPIVFNSHKMASASLIKIPIMIEAFKQKQQGKLDFSEPIIIRHANAVEGGSVYNLPDGTILSLGEIVELMIVQSDNTSANILIDKLKMENINAMIQQLGCSETILQRKMMDFEAVKKGRQNYTSVNDIALLLQKLHALQCLDPESDQAMLEIMQRQEDNMIIPAQLPHQLKIAHKTGQLDGMYYDCGIVYGKKGDYILCLMAENIKDEAHVMYDMSSLSLAIYDKIGR
ncbi:serine hydrolase [Azotosporobacter soli]|uniref:serine hydrolase n=1 Tax=Azotosporobacter soli TaxID=3055040 RepID=UPI0031FE4FC5